MRAILVIRERIVFADGALIEMKVWLVPKAVAPSKHCLKYSLFYGRPGQRLIGYDNERGRGDHRHYEDREEAYRFISIETLLADFKRDVEVMRGEPI